MKIEQPAIDCSRPSFPDQHGLTRVEWLIIVVALGILGTVSFPAYMNYSVRPKFSEVIQTLAPYKAAVEACARNGSCVDKGSLTGLGVGKKGVPPSISTTYMSGVVVSANGTITATASKAGGLAEETFILTPTLSKTGQITWVVSGTCRTREAGAIC